MAFSPGMMLTDMLTNPTVIGERVKDRMKNFGFVLRFLGKPPHEPARKLVQVLEKNNKEFVEYRMIETMVTILWTDPCRLGKFNQNG